MRKKIIAGNWKMNKTVGESLALIKELKPLLAGKDTADVVVCPPYTDLFSVGEALKNTNIALGAQDVFWKSAGAYTSQVSAAMLTDVGAKYVIIGHSETRGRFGVPEPDATEDMVRFYGESDATVNLKVKAALMAGLVPIVCVGETSQERQAGEIDAVVHRQTTQALQGVDGARVGSEVIFAYEPVWAIGTGAVCAADEADRVCGLVRAAVADSFGQPVADVIRI
ncbi:MAG: triose-phosphate isomerase, partial [Armatimonadota bacterium]|nr:triose-phosphate isomerase [Armatimonadota bacterium]